MALLVPTTIVVGGGVTPGWIFPRGLLCSGQGNSHLGAKWWDHSS